MNFNKHIKKEIIQTLSLYGKCCLETFLFALMNKDKEEKVYISHKEILEHLEKKFSFSYKLSKTSSKIIIFDINNFNFFQSLTNITLKRIQTQHCLRAYLAGLFYKNGYCLSPEKGNHLEISLNKIHFKILKNSNALHKTNFKIIQKDKKTVLYIKQQKQIIEFLQVIGCYHQAMSYDDFIALKQISANINRQLNFEAANLNKQISASLRQQSKFKQLLNSPHFQKLPQTLQTTLKLRLKYPYDTLSQLSKRFSPPITKSALNHRIRRLENKWESLCYKKRGRD